ncbi:MAG: ketopantoate reductase family protein [Alphaproteobacteria bacterium]
MRICVYGAGAVGGVLGVVLANKGHDVSLVAHGDHLAALQTNGCTLESGDDRIMVRPACSENPEDFGPQDFVIVTVKAPAMPSVAVGIAPLLGPETAVVPAMNGVPWWFFDGFPETGPNVSVPALDPDGTVAASISTDRVIGGVVHMGAMVPEPGVIRRVADNRLILGEASGGVSDRLQAFAGLFDDTLIDVSVTENLRQEIWLKLLGNFNFAPVSALTGATNDMLGSDPGLRKVCFDMFEEAAEAGRKIGLDPGMTADERIDLGAGMTGFRTSMLQDFDRGRPPEIDAIVTAVVELGRTTGTPMPVSEVVLALVQQLARGRGLYG